MSKVWLVTGSASGLGRDIAEAVLASGDRLLATARDPHRLNDLVERYGEQVHTAPLDVADEAAAKAAVEKAVEVFGRLDVVVNNAGYGDVAPFEQLSSERFRAVVDTNFVRRRLYDTSGDPGHAEAEEWLHPSDLFRRWQVGGSWKRSLSRGQMGCRWLHRSHCSGGCSLRRSGMCIRARWYTDQLGQAGKCWNTEAPT